MRWTILILLVLIDVHVWTAPQVSGGAAGQAGPGTVPADAVTAAVRDLKGSPIVTTSSEAWRYDKVLMLPEGKVVDRPQTGVSPVEITRVQVGEKDDKPVFIEIGLTKGTTLAPDAATALGAAIQRQDPRIQKCDGSLFCVRVCKSGGKERCCEWACNKTTGD